MAMNLRYAMMNYDKPANTYRLFFFYKSYYTKILLHKPIKPIGKTFIKY